MDMTDWIALGGFFALCFAAASTGAVFKPGEWYDNLAKPSWNPPKWAFPVAWSVLFCMIAVSGWLVWRAAGFAGAAGPLAVYVAQLGFNAWWSALFFGKRRIDLALVECAALWASIALNIVVFAPISPLAAWLLVPYFLWVSFATFLNWTLLRLNPRPRGALPFAAAAPHTPAGE